MSEVFETRSSSPLLFLALVLGSFMLSYIPIMNWPFSWMMTFFHEISHGIAALLTGGSIDSIRLHLRGSGLCTTIGGISFIISLAGYLGAVIWGMGIYLMADTLNKRHADELAIFIVSIVLLSAVLWGRDLITLLIMAVLIVVWMSIMKLNDNAYIKIGIKFIGIFILLDAIKAPLHLIDGRHYGDGARLADLTGIPELVWVTTWFLIASSGLYALWKMSNKAHA
ncbi:MAG: M50 family metallopeptidase [Mariprofundaceae bacterium]|nr:M50 family metallopeptidase [Mariprofundaceae bacterium]